MSGISTKGLKKSFVSKEIKPGNVVAKINNLYVEQVAQPRDLNVPEFKVFIELETRPIGDDFVGFDKVFGDPSKGQHLGQTKKIQLSDWALKDKSGISKKTGKPYKIEATAQILEFLQKLLHIVGQDTWLESNDGNFKTWDQLTSSLMRTGHLKDKYFSWCLAATESINSKGYPVYYIYLPDRDKAATPFAAEGGLVTTFDPAIHIKKDKKSIENDSLNAGEDEETVSEDENLPTGDDLFDDMNDADLFDLDDE